VPKDVMETASGLRYRDLIIVVLLLKELKIKNQAETSKNSELIKDNWIYLQDSGIKAGRLQIYNNWSPYMVKDPNTVLIGVEYFCNFGDGFLGSMSDEQLSNLAIEELSKIEIIDNGSVIDKTVIKLEKAYPAYFGSYDNFHVIRNFVDKFENLFLIGRNGMHRYNNQDHSMLTAIVAVDNIVNNVRTKDNLWAVNIDDEYHELKVASNKENSHDDIDVLKQDFGDIDSRVSILNNLEVN
jgi:protoporphyrinogen oxidase